MSFLSTSLAAGAGPADSGADAEPRNVVLISIDSLLDAHDRSIHHVDSLIERLFAQLQARGLLDNAFIVITADHGDSFGQHRYLSGTPEQRLFFEHSVDVWEETQRVPLLLTRPSPCRKTPAQPSPQDAEPRELCSSWRRAGPGPGHVGFRRWVPPGPRRP